ncbi:MAG: hypothetical protein R2867_45140 [Caldilineaceae bacterium]
MKKEVEGVDFVPSEEDSWFRVARVSHIYGADHASLEFEVELIPSVWLPRRIKVG